MLQISILMKVDVRLVWDEPCSRSQIRSLLRECLQVLMGT